MTGSTKILVIIKPEYDNKAIINKAKEFALTIKAHLHLLTCSESNKDLTPLTELAESLQHQDISASAEVTWHGSYHETIAKVQKAQDCHIIITSRIQEKTSCILLTSEDWKLLRTCPCPILIVNQNRSWKKRPVLAAVNLGNPENRHGELHDIIMRVSNTLSHVTEGEVHLVSVYPEPITVAEAYSDPRPSLSAEVYETYVNASKKYQFKYAITKDNTHICAGAPDAIIADIAKEIDAAVCVIGTVARTGLSAVLIGNTAETVLENLSCDILILKPNGLSPELEQVMKKL